MVSDLHNPESIMKLIYLLTAGDGSDGDEMSVRGIYSTEELGNAAKIKYDTHKYFRPDGSFWTDESDLYAWELDADPELISL